MVFLSAVILLIAATINRRHHHGALFCVLMAFVLLWWSGFSAYINNWFEFYAEASSYIINTTVYTTYYLTGCATNCLLLFYLSKYNTKFDTGYRLIFIPIAFYAVLSVLVPVEYFTFGTEHMNQLYNVAAESVNGLEVFLLAADRNDYRRNCKRWLASARANLHTLSPYSLFDRIR